MVHLSPSRESSGWIVHGFFRPGDAGTLRLHLSQRSTGTSQGNPPGIDIVLTKLAEAQEPPKPSGAGSKPANPKDAAVDVAPGDEEIVFIPRMGRNRPFAVLDAGDGVTLAIYEEAFHAADVITKVRIRYTAADGTVTGHDVDVAMDAFANREQWALLWVRGTKTFWHVTGEFDGKSLRLYRTDFADPRRIVTAYDANYEGEPLDALGIPADVRAKFEQHFGVVNPKPVDKSGGLPDVAGESIAAARALAADGSLPEVPVKPAAGPDRRWKVQFVDAVTGKIVPSLRAKVVSRTTDGERVTYVTRIVTDGTFERNLGGDEYAWVVIEDEKLMHADEGERLFGNVPAGMSAEEKHTNPNAPFIVKVKAREKTPNLTPDGLLGAWRGTVNEEKLMLSFHRPPAEKDVQLDIYFGEATIGVPAGFTIAEDGGSAEVVQHSAGGGMKFGALIPSEPGKLKLELYGRQKGQQELMLTRDAEAAATEPRQAEARELLAMWKSAAYGNETIPGGFLWNLVTGAQAYAAANPNLDSAQKLQELLDYRITERDWTQPQVIQLLNAATGCSDELLKECLASEKLTRGWLGTWEGKIGGRVCSLWIVRRGPAVTGITMQMLYPEEASVDELVYRANANRASLDLRLWNQDGKTTPFGRLESESDIELRFIPAGTKSGSGGVILTRKIEALWPRLR